MWSPAVVEQLVQKGALAQALARTAAGTAQPKNKAQWDMFSTWSLICEEILDTVHAEDWYDDVIAELFRRSLDETQITTMRRFACRTAGWLNYEKMAWEWVRLDETDIRMALDWQLRDGVISKEQYEGDVAFLNYAATAGRGDMPETALCELADNLFRRMDQDEHRS
jgi:hypothetical protein